MDTAGRFLRVRSIVGRSTDLYRGVSLDPATPREPSPGWALASIIHTLHKLDGVSVRHMRKAIVLARGGDEEELRIHVDVDPVTLPDLNLEGNPELAILALHALLPAFGAVELRDDDYTEIIDGTEPVAMLVERFQAKARADLAKIRATIGVFDRVAENVDAPPVRRVRRVLMTAVIVTVALTATLFAVWALRTTTRREPIGATCSRHGECESRECMSPDPYDETESQLTNIQKKFKNGVCTKYCRADRDCPKDMTCAEVVELDATSTGQPYRSKRCTPVAWQSAPVEMP